MCVLNTVRRPGYFGSFPVCLLVSLCVSGAGDANSEQRRSQPFFSPACSLSFEFIYGIFFCHLNIFISVRLLHFLLLAQ